jgi:hypothetical protein
MKNADEAPVSSRNRQLIRQVEEFAGDHSIQLPPALLFPCQEQGCVQNEAASLYLQCLMQRPAASLTFLDASGSSTVEAGLSLSLPLRPRPSVPLAQPLLRPMPWLLGQSSATHVTTQEIGLHYHHCLLATIM